MAQPVVKTKSPVEEAVLKQLETVIDPELGVDIVNLGLIYGVDVTDDGNCTLTMTLTTMGCPIGNLLADSIRQAVTQVPAVHTCAINLVWEPAWDLSNMSRYAKVALELHE
ncbi:metal-sulfur cluster assembly factor [Levilactobacillus suantsaii]|uniref:Metal-sulfur cluster assembly factor n=1 Tax=Levilactobacillus suantsaii TaxID=2292255 RepID=A0A4Q0VJY7_9LACO|nr:metal-sulfur cluster assembly factor [Levilactobacillus suantsaii]QMU08637.1 metal-sulfur cluster assembly factor [Levilactobacillus suantsaii]RXI78561.1 metal-sulfur cluster assembly factor [Levilactobacillus suantsaii]